ncbi:unnamed protein product, partial [Brassica oleracea var. botrytis]
LSGKPDTNILIDVIGQVLDLVILRQFIVLEEKKGKSWSLHSGTFCKCIL